MHRATSWSCLIPPLMDLSYLFTGNNNLVAANILCAPSLGRSPALPVAPPIIHRSLSESKQNSGADKLFLSVRLISGSFVLHELCWQ